MALKSNLTNHRAGWTFMQDHKLALAITHEMRAGVSLSTACKRVAREMGRTVEAIRTRVQFLLDKSRRDQRPSSDNGVRLIEHNGLLEIEVLPIPTNGAIVKDSIIELDFNGCKIRGSQQEVLALSLAILGGLPVTAGLISGDFNGCKIRGSRQDVTDLVKASLGGLPTAYGSISA